MSTARRLRLAGSGLAAAVVTLLLAALIPGTAASAAATPTGFWTAGSVPATPDASDTAAVELGLKFRSSIAGTVTGVRFYKSAANTGTHTASVWSAAGSRLAQATFTAETASGWQTVSFGTPVSLAANTTYVVSYYAPRGHYAYTENQFATSLTSRTLTAPSGSNGVYRYGISGFPSSSYQSTNYWVDPLFVPASTPTPTPTTPTTSTSTTTRTTTTTTTTTTTPPPPATGVCATAQVWQNLDACGWPGPASTGYPDNQVFARTVTGGLLITANNTVIDGYKITGGVQVRAQNVTIKNSSIANSAGGANGSGVVNINPGASATIDHNVLNGSNATHACIWNEGSSMTATANECVGVNDGIFSWATQTGVDGPGDNFLIQNNWLHNFTTQAANGHIDGFQTEGAKHGVIRHNTIDVSQDQDSAVAIWNSRKNVDDMLVDNNLLTGGGFSVYAEDYSPSEANPAGGYSVTNVSFTNNRFSNVHYACVGNWGVWFYRGAPSDGWRRTGNTVLETGQNLDKTNPVVNGWTCS